MIAGEAPVLLGKACELFVREVTMRAWRHTERNRRRTLQRQDVHQAVSESEVYDFLIDIVPRVAPTTSGKSYAATDQPPSAPATAEVTAPPNVPAATTVGGDAESGNMSVLDAERRLQQLQEMQSYMMMQQHMQADVNAVTSTGGGGVSAATGPGQPMPPQQMVMNPYMQAAPEQAAQWAQAMRNQQQQLNVPSGNEEQQGGGE